MEIPNQRRQRSEREIAVEYVPDRLGLGVIDQQLFVRNAVAERHHPADPHPLLFGSGNLVADAFAGDFALKLGEGQEDIQG
jgi:hypothetical protein